MSDVLQRIEKRASWIVGGIFLGLGGGITILSFFAMFYDYNPYYGFFPGCWMLTGGLLFVFVVLPYQEYHEEFRKAICREFQEQVSCDAALISAKLAEAKERRDATRLRTAHSEREKLEKDLEKIQDQKKEEK